MPLVSFAGVDWNAVEAQVSSDGIYTHFVDPCTSPHALPKRNNAWERLKRMSRGKRKRKGSEEDGETQKQPAPSLLGHQNGKIATSRIFGRQKGWGGPADLDSTFFEEDGEIYHSQTLHMVVSLLNRSTRMAEWRDFYTTTRVFSACEHMSHLKWFIAFVWLLLNFA